MKKISSWIPFLFLLLSTSALTAQNLFHENFDWKEVPEVPRDTCMDTSDQAIYLNDMIVLEYYFNEKNEFSMVESIYRRVLIRDKQAIDDFNKVYINVDTSADIISLKARAISPSGEMVLFNKDNIKEIEDEEGGGSKIFAVDGLVEGGVMELYYTIRKNPNIWGQRFFQSEYPRLTAEFRLITPEFLEFATYSHNGFPEAPGRLLDKERTYVAMANAIPGLQDEEYANYRMNMQKIEYTLIVNHNKSEARIFDYKQASQHYWEFYNNIQSSEIKEIKTILKAAGVKKTMDPETMIRAVDVYIKSNFLIVESIRGISKEDIAPLIKIKILDQEACVKLYVGILRELGIDFQIVLTANRFQRAVTKNFETWNNLDETLIYFPQTNAFLCPYSMFSRYDLPPYSLTGVDGLFIRKIEYQGLESGLGKIQSVPVIPSTRSIDSLIVKVSLPEDFKDAVYEVCYRLTGYRSYYFLQAYYTADEKEKVESALPYMKIISDVCEVDGLDVRNADDPATFYQQPVIISAKVKTDAPIEKAGDKYLFNIGRLIGEQSELYNEDKRVQPIEIEFQHQFYRHLSIEIPEGFRVTNPEILNTGQVYEKNGQTLASFKSQYTMTGRLIEVSISENYDLIRAPLEDYAPFKEVINAAADFNKLTLILERNGQ